MSYCSGCGRTFKGSRGLAIHRGKTGCGSSMGYSSSSNYFSAPKSYDTASSSSGYGSYNFDYDDLVPCDCCGREFKGNRGLAVHKAKSACGSGNHYAPKSYDTASSSSGYGSYYFDYDDLVPCDCCGREFKGDRGLAVHKAKSACGSGNHYATKSYDSASSSSGYGSYNFDYDDLVRCNNCGRDFKGDRGLAIHKAKSACGASTNLFSANAQPTAYTDSFSTNSYNTAYAYSADDNLVPCDCCGREFKGNRGLAVHKAKSACGSESNSSVSNLSLEKPESKKSFGSVSSTSSIEENLVLCNNCGREFKGNRGLAIHRAKSVCGSDTSSISARSVSENADGTSGHCSVNEDLVSCGNCGRKFKGNRGLAIHKAKSACGSGSKSSSQYTSTSSCSPTSSNISAKDQCGWCNICEKQFKGSLGLAVHRSKSNCSNLRINSNKGCTEMLFSNLSSYGDYDYQFKDGLSIHQVGLPDENYSTFDDRNTFCQVWLNTFPSEPANPEHANDTRDIIWPELDNPPVLKNSGVDRDEEEFKAAINVKTSITSDWRVNTKNFSQKLSAAFNKGIRFDVNFIISHANETIIIQAHRLVLSLASSVFEAMFYGSVAEKGDVRIGDASPMAINNILSYIYSNKLRFADLDSAVETLYVSRKYLIEDLETCCLDCILKYVNKDNVCELLEFSNLLELKELKKKCLDILNTDSGTVLKTDEFLNCSSETATEIVKIFIDKKSCSEKYLWEGLIEWSINQCREQEIYETEENLNSILEPVLDVLNSSRLSKLIKNRIQEYAAVFSPECENLNNFSGPRSKVSV